MWLVPAWLEVDQVATGISVLEPDNDIFAEEVGNLRTLRGRKELGAQVGSPDGIGLLQHKVLAYFESGHCH